ncbi:hypothetical protein BZL35_00380 [Candidatus Pandoraea novymonadis]|uniref:Uncharacterized protein n=1 Tax=Candidatus Pandoraea novymonadis TaxID=1808959 RepID=A0ABX5FEL4_9BURK|nr:hypothetical protein BZL35_00380 [Candidatus Pandoraea novymonadis]
MVIYWPVQCTTDAIGMSNSCGTSWRRYHCVKYLHRVSDCIELIVEYHDISNIFVQENSNKFSLESIAVGLIRDMRFFYRESSCHKHHNSYG